MPPPLRHSASLGNVFNADGSYRAQIKLSARQTIQGPKRGDNENLAWKDLAAIRAAAADQTTREGEVRAMQRQADKLKAEAKVARTGGTEEHEGGYRTRVQCVDNSGARKAIIGPIRLDERRAKADTERVCGAASASTTTRAEFIEGVQREAHRLQLLAPFEAKVAMMVNNKKSNRQHVGTDSETEPEIDPIHDEPFPDYDVSTRELIY